MSLRRFLRRAKWDRERLEEIESYTQMETDANIARGMPPGEAREAAIRKLGNRTLIREEIYRMNTIGFLDTLGRDLRYALRGMRHSPMFTADRGANPWDRYRREHSHLQCREWRADPASAVSPA